MNCFAALGKALFCFFKTLNNDPRCDTPALTISLFSPSSHLLLPSSSSPHVRNDPLLMAHPELSASRPLPGEGGASQLDVLGLLDSLGGEENSTAERCFRSHSRSSVLQGLPFGGVPTVLAINVALWMVGTRLRDSMHRV